MSLFPRPLTSSSDFEDGSGLRNYRTSIKVIVHSHQTSVPIELGSDVVEFSFSKTIKGTGKASLVLTPSQNYLNKIFPNDYINLYISRGDSHGWTRIFFGFIDRVSESFKITERGVPQSVYKVACSDFSKVFDRTQIYFNPAIMGREDFKSSFGGVNIGGIALFSRGLVAQGSPPDVVLQTVFSLLGFGAQFILPDSFMPNRDAIEKSRDSRAKFLAKGTEINAAAQNAAAITRSLDVANNISLGLATEFIQNASPEAISKKAVAEDVDVTNLNAKNPEDRAKLIKLFADRWVVNNLFGGNEDIKRQVVNALATTRGDYPTSLLDVLDLFTFVEREAIDGYMAGTSIWTQQGSLASFIQSYSNELVNELFWDLRAVNQGEGLARDDVFVRDADEIGGNLDDNMGTGVKYVPALVMREYPFSTIGSFDASGINLGIKGDSQTLGNRGILQFGNIFNDVPNEPGRHVIEIPNINLADLAVDQADPAQGGRPAGRPKQNKKAKKHIDVAVVSDQELVSMDVGRSDADHYNLFEIGSDALLGEQVRYITSDYLPIISGIDIEQHGLRVRSVATRFDRFTPQASPTKAANPVAGPKDTKEQNQKAPVGEGTPQLPIAGVTRLSKYGYRKETGKTTWQFHYGIDLYAPLGTTIVAPVDATVVASSPGAGPNDIFQGYGAVVVLKHKDGSGFSLYAHMDSRASNIAALSRNKKSRPNVTGPDFPGRKGKMTQIEVKAGDAIGTVGISTGAGTTFKESDPHCHIEVFTKYPANSQKIDESTPRTEPAPATPPTPDSTDPEEFFLSIGAGAYNLSEDTEDQPTDDGGTGDEPGKGEEPETEARAVVDAAKKPGAPAPTVDNKAIRYQLLRWALLQDHWYQHNKEYLSGTINMRGAPDIRVGYRLDLKDRALSFYVEAVTHSWKYPGQMMTTLSVTRGQPNNPYPAYVLPAYKQFGATSAQRKTGSRLATYFIIPDPVAVRKATVIRDGTAVGSKQDASVGGWPTSLIGNFGSDINPLDTPDYNEKFSNEALQYAGTNVANETETNEGLERLITGLEGAVDEEVEDALGGIGLTGVAIDPKDLL